MLKWVLINGRWKQTCPFDVHKISAPLREGTSKGINDPSLLVQRWNGLPHPALALKGLMLPERIKRIVALRAPRFHFSCHQQH